jgi:hypothetical protein
MSPQNKDKQNPGQETKINKDTEDYLTEASQILRNSGKISRGRGPPKDGIRIPMESANHIGALWLCKPIKKSSVFRFKFIVPFHPHKNNYWFSFYLLSRKLKKNDDLDWLEVNYPGLPDKINKVILSFLEFLEGYGA